eukprot:GILI01004288.1.p1 GENE.GILI01004288.1~~GILI01004288.1.p1  ORF type:complete len:422 (-),score=71.13 GILI01004288.1:139-1404(-)
MGLAKLLKCICCPCILIFQSIRIFCCGFLYVCCSGIGLCIKSCCCGIWETLCCKFCGCTKYYTDNSFKPSTKILGQIEDVQLSTVTWERLENICGGTDKSVLVNGGISPGEIVQGSLGNCWLLASMAAVAEYPALVRDVFVVKQKNDYQKYCFRLFDEKVEKFREISVDTFIPCIDGRPIFTQPNGIAMWVPLLEKAVAKMYGTFGALDGGSTEGGIRILTGAKIVRISRKGKGKPWARNNSTHTYKSSEIHELVRNFDYYKSIMTCSIVNDDVPDRDLKGLQRAHAYTLVGAVKVKGVELFKLRNPWGQGEWQGAWADSSPLWKQNASIGEEVEHKEADDGVFYMCEDDFANIFDYITMGVRESGFNDIVYEPNEGKCCGACTGFIGGCCSFWCCCGGCRALCCAKVADENLEKYDESCC